MSEGGYNITWGGNAPMMGRKHTEEWKKEASARMSGEKNWNYGKFGKENPLYGRKRTEEEKTKMIVSALGKTNSRAVIATGFDSTRARFREFMGSPAPSPIPQLNLNKGLGGSYSSSSSTSDDTQVSPQADDPVIAEDDEEQSRFNIPAFLRRNN